MDDDKDKIQMLLDPDHFFGESTGRLGPVVIFLVIALLPVLIYGYYSLWLWIPLKLFIVFMIIYVLNVCAKTLGRESYRMEIYKKKLHGDYDPISDENRCRTIHSNGCIEYRNGRIAYVVVTFNSTVDDPRKKAIAIRKFQENLVHDCDYDIRIHNLDETDSLEEKYNNVKLFSGEAASDFISIIDANIQYVKDYSNLVRVAYVIKGAKSEWKELLQQINNAISMPCTKVFKSCKLLTTVEEIESLLSRDLNGLVDLDDMTVRKYYTGEFYGSKVICYDDKLEEEIPEQETEKVDFHVPYE